MDTRPGEARIKAEYLKASWFPEGHKEVEINDDEAEGVTDGKKNKNKKKRERGSNKARNKKPNHDSIKLCKYIGMGEECPFGEKCSLSHNLDEYLVIKPKDAGDRCVLFDLYGKCSFGYRCRFLSAHLDKDNKLVVNEQLVEQNPVYTTNGIQSETQKALHHGKLAFPRSEAYLETIAKEIAEEQKQKDINTLKRKIANGETEDADALSKKLKTQEEEDSDNDTFFDAPSEFTHVSTAPAEASEQEKPVGPIDTGYRKLIDFRNKTYLAPLTTVGNLPFRRICKEYGVDITCGEMAMATNLLKGQQSEWALTKRHKSEDIFGIQICGSKVEHVAKAAEILNKEVDVDFIDLNMGCPIDLVFKQGAGSALLDNRGRMLKLLRGMQEVTDIPITAKYRLGVRDNAPTCDRVVPKLDEMGIALSTIHGRSRSQRYTRKADWAYVGKMKNLTQRMPLYGNGDIMNFEDYNHDIQVSGVDGVMIGRGALIKPWVFDEIKNQRHWDISANERFDMLKRFTDYGLEHWGSDTHGLNTTRRFLCEWQSFLYRYIPVGLLEQPPQVMNERPPPFQGRNDLETLMASPLASDWVKISELLLGPAPDEFKFIPKHKANSYENVEG